MPSWTSKVDFTALPKVPAGFVWVDEKACIRLADIQAVRDEFHSVAVFVRGREKPIEIDAPAGMGPDVMSALLDRMRTADHTTEK
ncbi:hypothetical protein ACFV3R_25475 [Streptomyces sp. NPDC059740]|uniref:hypothetical protein n=1 Tax=Streptomyces sp. NPDC059740 TaxID=3346926 RepID=UPI003659BD28